MPYVSGLPFDHTAESPSGSGPAAGPDARLMPGAAVLAIAALALGLWAGVIGGALAILSLVLR